MFKDVIDVQQGGSVREPLFNQSDNVSYKAQTCICNHKQFLEVKLKAKLIWIWKKNYINNITYTSTCMYITFWIYSAFRAYVTTFVDFSSSLRLSLCCKHALRCAVNSSFCCAFSSVCFKHPVVWHINVELWMCCMWQSTPNTLSYCQ